MALVKLSSILMVQLLVELTTIHLQITCMMSPQLLQLLVGMIKVDLLRTLTHRNGLNGKLMMNSTGLKTRVVLHSTTPVSLSVNN